MHHLRALLELKIQIIRNSLDSLRRRSRFEFITLLVFFIGAAAGLFFFFRHSFSFFAGQEPFGAILLDEAFYLFTFALFFMLFISTAVSAYASLFRSPEVPFLLTRNVSWEEVYFVRLGESIWFSSWSFLFVTIPFLISYGITKGASPFFPLICLFFFIPFILLAGMAGTLGSLVVVWLLPTRNHRRIALVALVIGVILFFARAQPEMIREQGSISGIMTGYLPHVAFAKSVFLPSCWLTRGVLAFGNWEYHDFLGLKEGLFYLIVLFSNMLFFLIPSYSIARRLFPAIYLRAQDHAEAQRARAVKVRPKLERFIDNLKFPPRPVQAFLEKDIKNFVRDPTEWSQLIIFFGLLLLYFSNLRNLEFHVLQDFWKNLVFVLNTIGTFIVLSSFNMRFVFPMLSLEGSRFWITDLSPIKFSSLLFEKFFLGLVVSLILSMPLVFLSGAMLDITFDRVLYATGMGFFVCVALSGLSVGFGAMFPNFKSTNPAEIISGFGGSLLLVTHLAYLTLIGIFLLVTEKPHSLIFMTVAVASILVGIYPLQLGIRRLQKMEF